MHQLIGGGTDLIADTLTDEPELRAVYSDTFSALDTSIWAGIERWQLATVDSNAFLSTTGANPLTYQQDSFANLAFEGRFNVDSGAVVIRLRENMTGFYDLRFDSDGQLTLYRNREVLQTVSVSMNATWVHLRVSAFGDTLRVAADGIEMIALRDNPTLPTGQLSIHPTETAQVSVDNLRLWLPQAEADRSRNAPLPPSGDILREAETAPRVPDTGRIVTLQTNQNCDVDYPNNEALVSQASEFAAIWTCALQESDLANNIPFDIYFATGVYPVDMRIDTTNSNAYIRVFGRLSLPESANMDTYTTIQPVGTPNSIVIASGKFELNNVIIEPFSALAPGIQVRNGSTLTIEDSIIRNHHSPISGGGLMIHRGTTSPANVTVRRTNFLNNRAAYSGGAIFAEAANLTVECVLFKDNDTDFGGDDQRGASLLLKEWQQGNTLTATRNVSYDKPIDSILTISSSITAMYLANEISSHLTTNGTVNAHLNVIATSLDIANGFKI